MTTRDLWRRLALVLVLLVAAGVASAQVVEEEDLPEPEIWETVIPTFDAAVEMFNSVDQPDSVALFDEFLLEVQEKSSMEVPPPRIYALVTNAYYYRAQVGFNLGDNNAARDDLRQLLTLEPAFAVNRAEVSTKFADLFDEVARDTVATVVVASTPPDATVTTGRWKANETGTLLLPTGTHEVLVERPGHSPSRVEVEARPRSVERVEVELERVSAVIAISTAQAGVEILIDGAHRGVTAPLDPDDPASQGRLVVDGLQPGRVEIAARRDGFREYLATADVEELVDYELPQVRLVPTSGIVRLVGMPSATVVRANGAIVTPDFSASPATLQLSPGEYRVALAHPEHGLFEADVRIEDQATLDLEVRLRPPLVLLGILGGDRSTAGRMTDLLRQHLGDLQRWALIEREEAGDAVLAAAEVELPSLRAFAQTGSREPIPWDRIQEEADRQAKGGLYLLGVLSDDLLAEQVHLFLLPRAPLPTRPDLVTLPLLAEPIQELAQRLERSILEDRPALGAIVVDSPLSRGPVLVDVSSDGAAAVAGLDEGDEILSLDGVTIESAAQLRSELSARVESHGATGQLMPVRVASPAGERDVSLALETSPVILQMGADILYSAAAYELDSEAQRPDSVVPKWVIQLDQAIVFLRAGDLQGAIQLLRAIQPPGGARLGSGQINYLLGLALSSQGGEYVGTASGFLTQAAEETDSRLYHLDGPLIPPRARVRLRALN